MHRGPRTEARACRFNDEFIEEFLQAPDPQDVIEDLTAMAADPFEGIAPNVPGPLPPRELEPDEEHYFDQITSGNITPTQMA